jgi:uncharacterized iron-regulated membrane protein
MNLWNRWLSHPQSLSGRRLLFSVHKWLGIFAGIYILAMSLSGGVLLFRTQLYRTFTPSPVLATGGARLSREALKRSVQRAWPDSEITWIWDNRAPARPTEVWLSADGHETQRLFDPFSGRDLGPATPVSLKLLDGVREFHRELFLGETGRIANITGGILLCLVSFTGVILWWPGISRWTRHLRIRLSSRRSRQMWEIHNVVGFCTWILVFLASATGALLSFEGEPENLERTLYRLHSGWFLNFSPWMIVWALVPLAISLLVVSGLIMTARRRMPRNPVASRQVQPSYISQSSITRSSGVST